MIDKLINKKKQLAVVGLGYVGLPIAVAFSNHLSVIGFDINQEKIALYQNGQDPTKEVGDDKLKDVNIHFTSNPSDLKKANFIIVAVPTPIKEDHTPDLGPLENATKLVGMNLTCDSIIVFESTVYPGVTQDICIPILEEWSGLKCGIDFKVGYSPERINPGDKQHRFENIVKVVSGIDDESVETISDIYQLVVQAGVFKASSILVAEAAKVIENAQRDINIAFMNELSIIFNKLDIDTFEVLEAAKTKWNFLNFEPGLVGGHCIGVDPYYLTHKAEQIGYISQIILAGRKLNDEMGKYIVENTIKSLVKGNIAIKNARIAILGFTFKEDCPDTRNTRVIDIINELKEYNIHPIVVDPIADKNEALKEYNITFEEFNDLKDLDALIIATKHNCFYQITNEQFKKIFKNKNNQRNVIIDVKGILSKKNYYEEFIYWRL